MSVTLTEGTATISTTEYSLPNDSTTLTPQTADCWLSVRVDFSTLVAGDSYLVKLYEQVNSGSSTVVESWPVTGAQVEALQLPLMLVGNGWDVTVTKTGGTSRSINWTLEKRSASITITDDAATIGTSEYSLPNDSTTLTAQTSDAYVQPLVSFANMSQGDRYRVRVYETMNGATARPILDRVVDGPQTKLWTCPVFLVGAGWDVRVAKVAGTDREIAWSLRVDQQPGTTYPAQAHASTVEAIRDRIIDLIEAITPTNLAGDLFRAYRNERRAEFLDWVTSAPAGAFRRFQVRDLGAMGPPLVSNMDAEYRLVTFQIAVAYPHTARYGANQALDRDDAMKADQRKIEQAVGLYGRANFVAPYPDACWRSDGYQVERVRDDAADFLVITQTMEYVEQLL